MTIFPAGDGPNEKKQFQEMRVAYLQEKSLRSFLCCCLPCLRFKDACLEIALFNRVYYPKDQIQALVNLGANYSNIKKITMSLYMMIEFKNQDDSGKILSKYTVHERMFEEIYDLRKKDKIN